MIRALPLAATLGVLTTTMSWAQEGVTKALVGRWEGEVKFRDVGADRNRTLVIESVREKAGALAATARFGTTGKKLQPVDADVQATGSDVHVGFVTRSGATVRLKLVQAKYLIGTYRFRGTRQQLPEVDMKLEKVQ